MPSSSEGGLNTFSDWTLQQLRKLGILLSVEAESGPLAGKRMLAFSRRGGARHFFGLTWIRSPCPDIRRSARWVEAFLLPCSFVRTPDAIDNDLINRSAPRDREDESRRIGLCAAVNMSRGSWSRCGGVPEGTGQEGFREAQDRLREWRCCGGELNRPGFTGE